MSNVVPTDEEDVLFEVKQKKCAIITLNRPKKLNSLNGSMLSKLINLHQQQSQACLTNLIIHKSNLSKSFCAGGDVVSVVQMATMDHFEVPIYMFQHEYSMNYMLGRLKKPVVALIDGITMGGGCGLSVHCPFRVATEKTKLAMPEMAIGFFPDVGASFFFTRLYGYLGWYLCLTGDILQGCDNLIAGTATHYISSDKIPLVEARLIELSLSHESKYYDFEDEQKINDWFFRINDLLDELSDDIDIDHKFKYEKFELNMIEEMFSESNTIEQVISYLKAKMKPSNKNEAEKSFAKATLEKFNNQSLLSLKIAYSLFRFSSKNTNYESLQMELNIAKNMNMFHEKTDLVEGVTTKLITKTNRPNWKFASIDEISDEYVEENFIKKNQNFGDIQAFNYNYGLFDKESMNYKMNIFTLPDFPKVKNSSFSKQNLLSKYCQYKKKKNLDYIINFHKESYAYYSSNNNSKL